MSARRTHLHPFASSATGERHQVAGSSTTSSTITTQESLPLPGVKLKKQPWRGHTPT
jgi:hypothetical protein